MERAKKFPRVVIRENHEGCTGVYPDGTDKGVYVFVEVRLPYVNDVAKFLGKGWNRSCDPEKGDHFAKKCSLVEADKNIKKANQALALCKSASKLCTRRWKSDLRKLTALSKRKIKT